MQTSPSTAFSPTKPSERLQQLLPELFNPQPKTGEAFLRLQVSPDLTVAIALDWVEETKLLIAQNLTPIPNMPSQVLGLMSNKGQVFWLLSLAQLLGFPETLQNVQRYEVVVVRVFLGADQQEELFIGLAVEQIKGSVRLEVQDIISIAQPISPQLEPFLMGSVQHNENSLLILNPESLSNLSLLSNPKA
jgi:positive phototaxis protein PixI